MMVDQDGFGYLPIRVGMFREMPGSDIQKQGYLKKLKTMKKKYFVLRSTSSSGPARLDYYDNEKKFRANQPAKRSIPLHTCFNINKKSDTKHKFAIALYLVNDCFSVLTDDEDELNKWLSLLLEYQNEYLMEGETQKAHFDFVWQGAVKQKTPQSCPGIQGPYRLCLSEKSVSLVKVTDFRPSYDFMLSSIRRCGHSDNFFFMEVGRSAVTGQGELWMQVDETSIAQSMHDKILSEMTSRQSDFRGRSNTGGSTISRRSTIHGDEGLFTRKRATSESHHGQGSPRRTRGHGQRPQSTVVYQRTLAPDPSPAVLPGTSPHSAFDSSFYEERVRSDSMGSRSSRTSKHSDFTDSLQHQNVDSFTSPEHSYVRSQTPETPVSITEEDPMENSDYLSMTPGQRSMTPSPTRLQGQMERSTTSSDYLPMTPTRRSGTPSPTRFMERPGSASSEPQDMNISEGSASSEPQDMNISEGYMDMRPGSVVSSPASNSSGYIDMMPGQRTPTDPGPGYMIMDTGWSRPTAPIPIRSVKEPGYMDMGPSSQPLPTVKEGGSGEAYLPMSPAGQSPLSSEGLKPAKVFSYLSDDSMSGEFPKRAYSVGSRPTPKPMHRQHHIETLRKQPLDSSKSSSAPHLIIQKSRSPNVDPYNNYMDMSSNASSLNQSLRSDDADSFMEMEFYRPRTASDSYGCRPRSSSFGKQVYQGHRPRASSYGQASKLSNLVTSARVDSLESVRRGSQDFIKRKRSQESLGKYSCSSNESLKKLSEDVQKKASVGSDYMDMGFEKNKSSSSVLGIGSPSPADPTGYVDMTLGTSTPKPPHQRGVSPSSSSQSLGSSPASGHGHLEKSQETKVVHPSGKVSQKQGFKPAFPNQYSTEQLKVATTRLKQGERKSPASSGKESEDESYVPFQPRSISDNSGAQQLSGSHDLIHKSHPGIQVQHRYSRSYDSAVKPVESSTKKSKGSKNKKEEKVKQTVPKHDKHETKDKKDKGKHGSHSEKGKHSSHTDRGKHGSHSDKSASATPAKGQQGHETAGHSPPVERKIDFIPESDLFSNAIFTKSVIASPEQTSSKTNISTSIVSKGDDSGYMDYLPGFEGDLPLSPAGDKQEYKPENKRGSTGFTSSLSKTGFNPESVSRESTIPQSNIRQTDTESDYILSDPDTNVEMMAGVTSPVQKDSASADDSFSYMDFDPSSERKKDEVKHIKSPVRVQSFFTQTDQSASEDFSKKSLETQKCSPNSQTECGESTGKECSAESTGKGCSAESTGKGSSAEITGKGYSAENTAKGCSVTTKLSGNNVKRKQTSNDKKQGIKNSNKAISVKKGSSDQNVLSDSTTVIDSKDNTNGNRMSKSNVNTEEIKAKFVVRSTKPDQELVDEGYIELDFTSPSDRETKKHHRSGSSSSTTSANSDRSRKGVDMEEKLPTPSQSVSYISVESEYLPKPEIPRSYICDNTEAEYLKGHSKEPNSPSKQTAYKTNVESGFIGKGYNSANTFVALDGSQSGVVFTPLNTSQTNQVFGQLSRQSSAPIGQNFSPRTYEEIQSIRSRKASGPANLSGARTSSGGSGKQLETLPAGQELQKQVSMPCMNIQLAGAEKIIADKGRELGQRHSYTDLSQYEEMSQANNLAKVNSGKSNSQQQLSGSSEESKLNYADLDLKGSSENVDEKSPRVNYATINFEKTESLKNAKEEVQVTL